MPAGRLGQGAALLALALLAAVPELLTATMPAAAAAAAGQPPQVVEDAVDGGRSLGGRVHVAFCSS